jgi:hypothetical protein
MASYLRDSKRARLFARSAIRRREERELAALCLDVVPSPFVVLQEVEEMNFDTTDPP